MPKFIVKSPLDYDHKPYAPGKSVELTDEVAAPLLAVNAIEPAAATQKGPDDAAERAEQIQSAIRQLDKETEANWMKDGRPTTEALAALLGFKPSAAERDDAWLAVSAAE